MNYTRKGVYGRESTKTALFHEIGLLKSYTVVHLDEMLQIVSSNVSERRHAPSNKARIAAMKIQYIFLSPPGSVVRCSRDCTKPKVTVVHTGMTGVGSTQSP